MKKKKKSTMEENQAIPSSLLPNDLVDEIFSRLPVKTLIRLKCLSRKWRSTIESHRFSQRHLKISEQSQIDHPKVMVISEKPINENKPCSDTYLACKTISLESDSLVSFNLLKFPQRFYHKIYISGSCDGLFCIHAPKSKSIYVVNPATRWFRKLPPARFQFFMHKLIPSIKTWNPRLERYINSDYYIAFVKAPDYKLVCLYNSDEYNSDVSSPNEGVTKCEVFDFRANAWRYLTDNLGYRIFNNQAPVSENGSLYWFTEPYNGEIQVAALDIHTEKFRLLANVSVELPSSSPHYVDMYTLDNRLCASLRVRNSKKKKISRLTLSEDLWEELYTLDWDIYSSLSFRIHDNGLCWIPVTINRNKEILLFHCNGNYLVKYHLQTKSLSFFSEDPCIQCISYFESLISDI